MKSFSEKLFKRYYKVEEKSFLASLRMSFLFLVPVFLIGALTLTVQYFPVAAVREFAQTALDSKISEFLQLLYNATYTHSKNKLYDNIVYPELRILRIQEMPYEN